MSVMDLDAFDATMRDIYAAPGDRLKQWVVDMGREQKWERETCPCVEVGVHLDARGSECVSWSGTTSWNMLRYQDCDVCLALYEDARCRPDIVAWLADKAARPPICTDHEQLSDQIQSDVSLRDNPLVTALSGKVSK